MSAESIRQLWAKVEEWGRLPVLNVVQSNTHHDWSLLVQVPWCKFAREVTCEDDYWQLIGLLEQWTTQQLAYGADPVALEHRIQQLGPEFRRDGHEAEMAAADAALERRAARSERREDPAEDETNEAIAETEQANHETQPAMTGYLF